MAILPVVSTDPRTRLPELSPVVQAVLHPFLPLILTWVSALVYEALLVHCARDPLVCLAQRYDPLAVPARCIPYDHHAGPGAARLARAQVSTICGVTAGSSGST